MGKPYYIDPMNDWPIDLIFFILSLLVVLALRLWEAEPDLQGGGNVDELYADKRLGAIGSMVPADLIVSIPLCWTEGRLVGQTGLVKPMALVSSTASAVPLRLITVRLPF
uniref:Uncharacterized protein n=1 Tax=Oryza sativa subsp. japonica TaxID=39947 RepID=Q6K374_ORYSJ|nr:hypothetical protein [Oryza sativa Japonica Group]BAD22444.1 hypothetical protein [Oryza sativa Japonica Group]